MIFNNSTGEPQLAAYKQYKRRLKIVERLPVDLMEALIAGQVPIEDTPPI
jgi:hypothetical protein